MSCGSTSSRLTSSYGSVRALTSPKSANGAILTALWRFVLFRAFAGRSSISTVLHSAKHGKSFGYLYHSQFRSLLLPLRDFADLRSSSSSELKTCANFWFGVRFLNIFSKTPAMSSAYSRSDMVHRLTLK